LVGNVAPDACAVVAWYFAASVDACRHGTEFQARYNDRRYASPLDQAAKALRRAFPSADHDRCRNDRIAEAKNERRRRMTMWRLLACSGR
jgi:hypothetical protein